jgi:transposase
LFETLDRPAALPLPAKRYEFAEWRKATVGSDYHILADHHHYSVPYQLTGYAVEVRLATNTVEVLLKGKRVASHQRSFERGATTTNPEHMPRAHRSYASADCNSLYRWAQQTGPATTLLFEQIRIRHNAAPSALLAWRGIYRLAASAGADRIEQAAARAVAYGSCTYTSIKRILSANLDQINHNKNGSAQMIPLHENIRGSQYFNEENSI